MSESIHGSIEPMRSEMIPPRDSVTRIDALISEVMSEKIAPRLSANQRAAAAWFGSNGDRERSHTTRVFLRAPRVEAADPVICVYVDSHAYLTDLTTNRDLYLARLANWGFYVSGIEFAVDRDATRHRAHRAPKSAEQTEKKGEPPSPELLAKVEEMVKDVPPSLKETISKAIIASMSQNDKKGRQD